ncbi:class I SAM-dependent methyltransferase [Candidatus Woesearchaeota archaeon]|nr:class I SAM-dependent methyltransferase [Candidatus Woesearchaeota archaeon]
MINISDIEDIHPEELTKKIVDLDKEDIENILQIPNKNSKLSKCPLCGSSQLFDYCNKNKFNISKCSDCDFGFVNPYPSNEQLSVYYNGKAKDVENEVFLKTKCTRMKIFEERVSRILNHIKNGKLLDIGGSLGFFVESLKNTDIKPTVVDLNASGCKAFADKFPDVPMYNQDFMVHDGKYNIVTLWDSLEHLPSIEKVIAKLNELVKDDGYLFMSTPNVKSFEQFVAGNDHPQVCPPSHVNYFNCDNLKKWFSNNGFDVIETITPNGSFDVAFVKKLIESNSVDNSKLGLFLKEFLKNDIFATNFADSLSKSCLGGNVIIVAKKKRDKNL